MSTLASKPNSIKTNTLLILIGLLNHKGALKYLSSNSLPIGLQKQYRRTREALSPGLKLSLRESAEQSQAKLRIATVVFWTVARLSFSSTVFDSVK